MPEPKPKSELRKLAEPLVRHLCENHHPHTTIVVTCTGAELMETMSSESIKEFIKD